MVEYPDKYTPLHYACQHGRIDILKQLITKYNYSIEDKDEHGHTLLHTATQYGHLETVKYILHLLLAKEDTKPHLTVKTSLSASLKEVFRDVLYQYIDNEGNTPLHTASKHGCLDIIRFFINEMSCDPNLANHEGLSCLHLATEGGHLPVVQYLLEEAGSDINFLDKHGRSPTYLAAGGGHLNILMYMIEEQQADANFKTANEMIIDEVTFSAGKSLVHIASHEGHIEVVKYLVEQCGCDPACKDIHDKTPLYLASGKGHLDVVQYLICTHHCEPSCLNEDNVTPLHHASYEGHLSVVKFLTKEHNCDPMLMSSYNNTTSLHYAALNGKLPIVKYFVEDVACDPNSKGFRERTPLHYASENGHLDVVEYLIYTHHCDHSCLDEDNETPLHRASSEGHLSVVKFLTKEHNCDPMLKNSYNNTSLHYAALNGKLPIVKHFVEDVACDPNSKGFRERTPLHDASQNGHLDVVEYLICTHHCDPSCLDENNATPLHRASSNGHLSVVKFLTKEHNCDPMSKNSYNNTSLHLAALNGKLPIVKHFVEDVACDPNSKGPWERTPLHHASQNGHLDVVEYLIYTHHCDPSCLDEDNETPLHRASSEGHLSVVKFLTKEHNCDPMLKNSYNNTSLHYAALNGKLPIVKHFVEDVACDPNSKGRWERTPLHDASQNGHLDVVEYLIYTHHCDPSCLDEDNETPLHRASSNGHLSVVKFLTKEYNCDPMLMSSYNNTTSLHYAALNGKLPIVKYFVEDVACDPNSKGFRERTPLHDASQNGHLDVVEYLICTHHCDLSCLDENNATPLHRASSNGHLSVVKFLTKEHNCDPMSKNSYNNTSLHLAALNGKLPIVKHFVEDVACDPNSKGPWERTPLHHASANGHLDVVEYLIYTHHCDPSCLDEDNETPLHRASSEGHLSVVKFLTKEHNCDPMLKNSYSNTSLHYAALNGKLPIVKYFVEDVACDPNSKGRWERTPLHYACLNGHFNVVQYLTCNDCNINVQDRDGRTPLHYACSEGHIKIVDCLLEHKCNPLITCKSNQTPLHQACKKGHQEVCKLLISTQKFDLNSRDITGKSVTDYATEHFQSKSYFRQVFGINKILAPKVFVIGYSESGKTTLVSALQREQDTKLWGRIFNVPEVAPHTIGVVPTNYSSSHYGYVQLYDFAGHEEYHANHELLFKNTLHPIALITVDLTLPVRELMCQVKYWRNIIYNSIQTLDTTASVIVIGSHYDKMKNVTVDIMKRISDSFCDDISSRVIGYFGLITLDCRKSHSPEMERLRKILHTSCVAARNEICRSKCSEDLDHFIQSNFSDTPACSMELFCEIAKALGFIPNKAKSEKQLFQMCESHSYNGKLLLLRNNSSSWLILNEHKMFSFALTELEKTQPHECGLLSLSQIREISVNKKLDVNIVIDYLLYAQVCTEVHSESFSVTPSFISTDKYYFFPSLIRSVKPDNIPPLSQDTTPFYGWCLVCKDSLTPRFLQVLFIQLTVPLTGAGDIVCPKYTIWKNGIYIANNDTTETYIEVSNFPSQVMLAIRCKVGNESYLTRRRSHLISLVLSTVVTNCPSTEFIEYIFKPHISRLPNEHTEKVGLNKLAHAIIEERPSVIEDRDNSASNSDLCTLLHFEPFQLPLTQTLKCFFLHPNDSVPRETLKQVSYILEEKYPGFNLLRAKILTSTSYKELHTVLSQYSVFQDRNIWELAGVKLEAILIAPLKYQFRVDPPKLYIHDDVPVVSIEEGESFEANFEVSSTEPYEYGHTLHKEDGSIVNQHSIYTSNNSLWFMRVSKKNSGMYFITPSNQRWSGQQKVQLDIRYSPRYYLEKDLLESEEGSSPVINFQVSSNPPLPEDSRHRLTKHGSGPVTKRFKLTHNSITFCDLKRQDSGHYTISCENEDKKTGEEQFEIRVIKKSISRRPSTKILSMEDHFQVTGFLDDLTNEQLLLVGGGLGLSYPHLRKMSNLLNEMVAAWLNEEDSVTDKSGPPSWTSLITVLEKVGQRGISTKIRAWLDESSSAERNNEQDQGHHKMTRFF